MHADALNHGVVSVAVHGMAIGNPVAAHTGWHGVAAREAHALGRCSRACSNARLHIQIVLKRLINSNASS